jgi:hypothetical protein
VRLVLLGSFVAVTMVSFGQSSLAEINSPLRQSETNVYSSQVIAFNAPNFRPEVSFSNGVLSVSVPTSFFEGPINEILRANLDGNHKSTEFQKIDISSTRVSFTNGGLNVNGNWQFQSRELLAKNPITGKKHYSPWVSVSGSFVQPFNVSVKNDRLIAQAGRISLSTSGKWYHPFISDSILSRIAERNTRPRIDQELQNFNGMNVRQLLVNSGTSQVAQGLRVNSAEARKLIDSRVGGMNAQINGGRLKLVVRVK